MLTGNLRAEDNRLGEDPIGDAMNNDQDRLQL
jgi:hypothetical protein